MYLHLNGKMRCKIGIAVQLAVFELQQGIA